MGFRVGLAERRKERLERELGKLVREIAKFGVERIVLFGSLASGNVHRSSDIDLIVVQRTEERFMERLDKFYKLKPNVAVDIFVYTPEEFDEMKEKNHLIKSALKEGKVVYERRQ